MCILKMVVPLMFLYFVSIKGFPSHEKTEKYDLKSIETGANLYLINALLFTSLVTAVEAHPSPIKMLQDEPSSRMTIQDELPRRTMLEDYKEQRKPEVAGEPPKRRMSMEREPLPRIPGDRLLPSLTTRTKTKILTDRPRDKRAVIWRAPPIRIPSITRLIRPVSAPKPSRVGSPSAPKGGPKPEILNSGSPTVNSKLFPKGESKFGSFGAGSPPTEDNKSRSKGGSKSGSGASSPLPEDSKSRPKGGSKSGGSNSFSDFGDLPSPDGWRFPDFSGYDSDVGSGPESETNVKEDDISKTTTDRNKQKSDHHHFDHGEHFPDYDYHGLHHW